MRRWAVLIAFCLCQVAVAAQDSFPKLAPEELKQMVDDKVRMFFLDVREPAELEEAGTLEGYVNIPVGQVESRMGEIPKEVQLVVACRSASRAARTARLLLKNGYKDIRTAAMLEYKAKGYPLIYPKAEEKNQ